MKFNSTLESFHESAHSNKHQILVITSIILLTLGVFFQVRHFKFLIYDDPLFVSENQFIRDGLTWNDIKWAFSADLIFESSNADYWQPVTFLSRMMDVELFGLNPSKHHLMNLFYHIANAVLVFYILNRFTGALWQSAFVAILFAIHPLQISSVAWVTERKDVLSTFFGLLTLGIYLEHTKHPSTIRRLLTVMCFTLSLMSKPLFASFPFALLLLDYWPLKRFDSSQKTIISLFLEKWVLYLLALISCWITWSRSAPQAIINVVKMTSIINAPVIYLRHLANSIYPISLPIIYPWQNVSYSPWVILESSVIMALTCYLAIRYAKKHPYFFVGWFWFAITLAPMARLKFENRYMYVPIIGILIAVAWGVPNLFQNTRARKLACALLFILTITFCATQTYKETSFWKNDEQLFNHALHVSPNIRQVHVLYAASLVGQGKIDEALPYFLKVLKNTPEDAMTYNTLATMLFDEARFDKAIMYYVKAIQAKPDYAVGYNNLCYVYRELNRYEEAVSYCQKALSIQPAFSEAYFNLAHVTSLKGDDQQAIDFYSKVIEVKKDYAEAYYQRGVLLTQLGKSKEGMADFEHAIKINPHIAEFYAGMAHALVLQHKLSEAYNFYLKSLRLDPQNAQTHNNFANLLAQMKRFEDAIPHYQEAIRYNPSYAEAYNNFAVALMEIGDFSGASQRLQEALKIKPDYQSAIKNLNRLASVQNKPTIDQIVISSDAKSSEHTDHQDKV